MIDPERTLAIRDFPPSKNVKAVARFVGMVFFSKFIPKFSELAEPLNRLRKKGVKFRWDHEQQVAFQSLKQAIASSPVLAMADFRKTFVLQTDACGSAVAAVLLQDSEEGLRAAAYASRTLSDQERK
ncbi:hypothetical protein ANN_10948 [Periplaneta americana]|uniref:Reverse transcriptase/retrotransposon-derived protein RNase H-like domain-containing protein n=1 Tax=Periplaneta americana TaxID=6978 RepID=A0ABQ8T4C8_PERAM|nr:hypothetical protein ANN_10948 [Periplaneta americana]